MKKAFIVIAIIALLVVVILFLRKPRITVEMVEHTRRIAVIRINGKTREFQYDKEGIQLGRYYGAYSIEGSVDPTGLHWINLLKNGEIVETLHGSRI